MGFRKLTESEVEVLLGAPVKDTIRLRAVVEKYYIHGADCVGVSIQCDSEYNDSTYDNRVQAVVPIGPDGLEMQPKKGEGPEARRELIAATRSQGFVKDETNDPLEQDVFIRLNGHLELYVKE